MTRVTELGYIGIEASDLAAWERFAVDLLGLQPGVKDEAGLTLRMDDKTHRMIIVPGPADDLAFSGYACASETDLDALTARLREAGHGVEEGDEALAAARAVERIAVTADPAGNRIELYVGLRDAGTPFHSDVLHSRFQTGTGGAGHTFLMEKAPRQDLLDFYALLGFKVSDYCREEVAPGVMADAVFLHCNGRHHTVGLADMPVEKKMHHFLIEVGDINDVGEGYDRCLDAGTPMEMTLGMHPNDQMFSFYVRTPSGFAIEYGWGGLIIDEGSWTVREYDQLDSWGHRAPAQVAAALSAGA